MPGLSWTGQPSLCCVAPVPWDWDYATRFDLVESFLISMLRLVHSDSTSTHNNTLHSLYARIHIVKERCLAWPRGRWKLKQKWRKWSVCCFVWADVPFWNRLFMSNCFDFTTKFRKLKIYARTVRAFELDLSLDFRPPNSTSFIPTSCQENALVRLRSWEKKTVTFYFHISMGHCEGYERQKAIHSDDSCLQGQRHPSRRKRKAALVLILTVKWQL